MLIFPLRKFVLTLALTGLTACDMLGLPNPAKDAAQAEAEGKAVGAACRHSGRSLEDCYALYPDQSRALVFAGWREMQDYMAAGNLTAVPPTIAREPPKPAADEEADAAEEPPPTKSSKKRAAASADDEYGGVRSKRNEAGAKQASTGEQ